MERLTEENKLGRGIEPEEVKEHEAAYIEIMTRTYGPIHEKIGQWLQAEKDGRLVVLPPNDPLTLEELREMDGQAVWCEDEHCAGIISVDIGGKWAGVPFLIFRVQGVNCTYNIKERRLSIYRRKPEGR